MPELLVGDRTGDPRSRWCSSVKMSRIDVVILDDAMVDHSRQYAGRNVTIPTQNLFAIAN